VITITELNRQQVLCVLLLEACAALLLRRHCHLSAESCSAVFFDGLQVSSPCTQRCMLALKNCNGAEVAVA
jgi:hypothetical protein